MNETNRPAATETDREHLKLLSIFHYVLAGIVALVGCIPLIHFVVGIGMITGGVATEQEPGLAVMGCFFMALAAVVILLAWGFAAALVLAGKFLAEARHWTYCLVIAAIACTMAPLGTILGVFTIIVLVRPSVKEMFEAPGH